MDAQAASILHCLRLLCHAGGIMKCDVIAAGIVNAAKGVRNTSSSSALELRGI